MNTPSSGSPPPCNVSPHWACQYATPSIFPATVALWTLAFQNCLCLLMGFGLDCCSLNWACSWPDNEWFWPEWDSNQGLHSYEPSGQIDLKPKALLSGDTMYTMHDILLYVWQLHHLNYFKRFKIVLLYYFQWKSICWFLIYFPWILVKKWWCFE